MTAMRHRDASSRMRKEEFCVHAAPCSRDILLRLNDGPSQLKFCLEIVEWCADPPLVPTLEGWSSTQKSHVTTPSMIFQKTRVGTFGPWALSPLVTTLSVSLGTLRTGSFHRGDNYF